jgi:hypothetical protein
MQFAQSSDTLRNKSYVDFIRARDAHVKNAPVSECISPINTDLAVDACKNGAASAI